MTSKTLSTRQWALLANASSRTDGAIVPLALSKEHEGDLEIAQELVDNKLCVWAEVCEPSLVWDIVAGTRVGLLITDLGCIALELLERPFAEKALPGSKIGSVISLLRRNGGATLYELTTTTRWQPHSVRAALTNLRKKGFAIEKHLGTKDSGPRYQIVEGGAL